MAHSLRSVGSAALNFCLVASGALDLYWEIGCWPWDVCAAAVIASEAGCLVTGGREAPHNGVVGEEILVGRKYAVVRAVTDTPVSLFASDSLNKLMMGRMRLERRRRRESFPNFMIL
jgi:myo-inositol-1(or 4)-monophosphatase